jgi:hypothetical protein
MIKDPCTAAIVYEAAILLLAAHIEELSKDMALFETESGEKLFTKLSERLTEYSFKLSTLRGDLKEFRK